jgi:hypothetical protein
VNPADIARQVIYEQVCQIPWIRRKVPNDGDLLKEQGEPIFNRRNLLAMHLTRNPSIALS